MKTPSLCFWRRTRRSRTASTRSRASRTKTTPLSWRGTSRTSRGARGATATSCKPGSSGRARRSKKTRRTTWWGSAPRASTGRTRRSRLISIRASGEATGRRERARISCATPRRRAWTTRACTSGRTTGTSPERRFSGGFSSRESPRFKTRFRAGPNRSCSRSLAKPSSEPRRRRTRLILVAGGRRPRACGTSSPPTPCPRRPRTPARWRGRCSGTGTTEAWGLESTGCGATTTRFERWKSTRAP